MRKCLFIVFSVSSLAACGVPQPADLEVVRDVQLSEGHSIVGVTVQPNGTVAVLDAEDGVFELDGDALVQVASPETLQRDGADLRPYTDIVAMDDGIFAVTVLNDGLRLDVETQTTTQHFCYLPGGEDGLIEAERSQLTHAVGYDPENDVLFAQPQSFLGNELTGAEVGTYNGQFGGQPEGWFELKREEFKAGGMVWDGNRLLMADADNVLHSYTLGDHKPVPYVDLGGLDLGVIQGMSLGADGTLLVVDSNDLVELQGWRPE